MASIQVTVIHKGVSNQLRCDNRDSLRSILVDNGFPTSGVSISVDDNLITAAGMDNRCLVDGSVIKISASKQASGC